MSSFHRHDVTLRHLNISFLPEDIRPLFVVLWFLNRHLIGMIPFEKKKFSFLKQKNVHRHEIADNMA